ncbi:HTTM domain-containing protein [Mariniblastus fucicola]|uniref:HTTM-like domain-containing protein n=1 Tax=Mariniblastus fucicola TaxID=980251 RepID=A0A5B9PP63_9BACT|nr:HTTM domain-containing protein [Mariniblastus fucicola]QEG24341.1 hypothetical protein MFFC18_42600 [Mariniblastus fucicola]
MIGLSKWIRSVCDAWDSFWFTPRDGKMLGLIRLLTGLIAFYTHLVWTPLLSQFLGSEGMLPLAYRSRFFESVFAWSHFDWISSPSILFVVHIAALIVMLLFALGFWTRVTGIATALLVISYANRATGALFGLDQITGFLTLYLAISNCGGSFSLARKLGIGGQKANTSVGNNIAIRLMQIHLCIVYLFAGLGKCQGETWWNGEAIWGAVASYEYQTLDMTWLADHMWFISLMTLVTLVFEIGYVALIWPKLTRPVMLALAVPLHLGIGLCMGMLEFGLIMLVANLAFVGQRD